jgi:hypothetical protein
VRKQCPNAGLVLSVGLKKLNFAALLRNGVIAAHGHRCKRVPGLDSQLKENVVAHVQGKQNTSEACERQRDGTLPHCLSGTASKVLQLAAATSDATREYVAVNLATCFMWWRVCSRWNLRHPLMGMGPKTG